MHVESPPAQLEEPWVHFRSSTGKFSAGMGTPHLPGKRCSSTQALLEESVGIVIGLFLPLSYWMSFGDDFGVILGNFGVALGRRLGMFWGDFGGFGATLGDFLG